MGEKVPASPLAYISFLRDEFCHLSLQLYGSVGVLIFSCNPSNSRLLQGPEWRGETKSAPIFVPHRTKHMDAAPIISIDKRGISEIPVLVESEEKREKSE